MITKCRSNFFFFLKKEGPKWVYTVLRSVAPPPNTTTTTTTTAQPDDICLRCILTVASHHQKTGWAPGARPKSLRKICSRAEISEANQKDCPVLTDWHIYDSVTVRLYEAHADIFAFCVALNEAGATCITPKWKMSNQVSPNMVSVI